MQVMRRFGPDDLDRRVEEGHQQARAAIRQVPLLRIDPWDGPVMLGGFAFDGRTAGVAHLTPDHRPARPGAPSTGGRIDTLTRIRSDGDTVLFPWDDVADPAPVTPEPTGRLGLTIDGDPVTADAWYHRGDWVCSVVHGGFLTTVTAHAVPLERLHLVSVDDLEPLLEERADSIRRWATPPR